MSEFFDLESLLQDLSPFVDEEAYAWGETYFQNHLIGPNRRSGVFQSHDNHNVTFFADRFHHAFRTSHDRARHAYSKTKVARERIERIRWVLPIIQGKVNGVECWEVPLKVPQEGHRCFPGKRLYVCWEESFIVWLEPLRKGGFKFSTCYVSHPKEIKRYTKRGRLVWRSDGTD